MSELHLPSQDQLMTAFIKLSQETEPIRRCISALETGQFVHPDGRVDDLDGVRIYLEQAALISHLCVQCPLDLSVEVGFGMGSSAAVILGTRTFSKQRFEHLIFDPYGLSGNRGCVVQSYLELQFQDRFRRINKPSEIGLGQVLDERGPGSAGLVLIDGGHRFENVMTDFVLGDRLCGEGGYIILDDAWFPAIETVVNYVRTNRPDYAVAHLPAPNTSVLQKIAPDRREWSAFRPFSAPDRSDWDPGIHAEAWYRARKISAETWT
jgi:hypothetical protein